MQKITFAVTYERVNEEEARIGDTDRRGYLGVNLGLRDALNLMGFGSTRSTGRRTV